MFTHTKHDQTFHWHDQLNIYGQKCCKNMYVVHSRCYAQPVCTTNSKTYCWSVAKRNSVTTGSPKPGRGKTFTGQKTSCTQPLVAVLKGSLEHYQFLVLILYAVHHSMLTETSGRLSSNTLDYMTFSWQNIYCVLQAHLVNKCTWMPQQIFQVITIHSPASITCTLRCCQHTSNSFRLQTMQGWLLQTIDC